MILKGRFVLAMLMVLCSVQFMSTAGNGLSGINEATNMVSSYFEPGVKLIYAIGAVVGLIGGVKCYSKWSSGDPDTSKTAAFDHSAISPIFFRFRMLVHIRFI